MLTGRDRRVFQTGYFAAAKRRPVFTHVSHAACFGRCIICNVHILRRQFRSRLCNRCLEDIRFQLPIVHGSFFRPRKAYRSSFSQQDTGIQYGFFAQCDFRIRACKANLIFFILVIGKRRMRILGPDQLSGLRREPFDRTPASVAPSPDLRPALAVILPVQRQQFFLCEVLRTVKQSLCQKKFYHRCIAACRNHCLAVMQNRCFFCLFWF